MQNLPRGRVEEEKNKIGPHLVGIFGRQAGSVGGFKYSDAMKSSGVVWEDETIAAYLKDPKAYIPGNRMAFPGLRTRRSPTSWPTSMRKAEAEQA